MVVDLQLRSWDGGVLLLSQIPWYVTVRSCEETQTENWNCVNLTSSKKNKKTNQVTMTNTKQLTTLMKYLTLCLSSVSQNPWHFWAFPAKYSNSATHSNLQNLVSPTPGVGWFLHEMGRYIYIYICSIYIFFLLTYTYIHITGSSYQTLKINQNQDFAISTRFTGSPFLVFFWVQQCDVQKQARIFLTKLSWNGLRIPTQSFRRKTWHDESFTTGESPLLIWFHIAWN